jgi:hypothetical protein
LDLVLGLGKEPKKRYQMFYKKVGAKLLLFYSYTKKQNGAAILFFYPYRVWFLIHRSVTTLS